MLARVLEYTLIGWPNHVTEEELKPYFTRRHKLTADQGCLIGNARILQGLHEEHPGIVAMKAIAWSYLWWPNLDVEIELTESASKSTPVPMEMAYSSVAESARVWQRALRRMATVSWSS